MRFSGLWGPEIVGCCCLAAHGVRLCCCILAKMCLVAMYWLDHARVGVPCCDEGLSFVATQRCACAYLCAEWPFLESVRTSALETGAWCRFQAWHRLIMCTLCSAVVYRGYFPAPGRECCIPWVYVSVLNVFLYLVYWRVACEGSL